MTSECCQRTPDTPKGSPFSSNIKDKKRDKRVRDGDPSQGGNSEGEVSKHQETRSPAGLWGVLEFQRAT